MSQIRPVEIEPPNHFDEARLQLTIWLGYFLVGYLVEKFLISGMKHESSKTPLRIIAIVVPTILIAGLDLAITHSIHQQDFLPAAFFTLGMFVGHSKTENPSR